MTLIIYVATLLFFVAIGTPSPSPCSVVRWR